MKLFLEEQGIQVPFEILQTLDHAQVRKTPKTVRFENQWGLHSGKSKTVQIGKSLLKGSYAAFLNPETNTHKQKSSYTIGKGDPFTNLKAPAQEAGNSRNPPQGYRHRQEPFS